MKQPTDTPDSSSSRRIWISFPLVAHRCVPIWIIINPPSISPPIADLSTEYLELSYGRGGHGMSGSSRTKRMRTSFKHHQLRTMKSYFAINHNPDAKDLKNLAQKTGLPKRVLQVCKFRFTHCLFMDYSVEGALSVLSPLSLSPWGISISISLPPIDLQPVPHFNMTNMFAFCVRFRFGSRTREPSGAAWWWSRKAKARVAEARRAKRGTCHSTWTATVITVRRSWWVARTAPIRWINGGIWCWQVQHWR